MKGSFNVWAIHWPQLRWEPWIQCWHLAVACDLSSTNDLWDSMSVMLTFYCSHWPQNLCQRSKLHGKKWIFVDDPLTQTLRRICMADDPGNDHTCITLKWDGGESFWGVVLQTTQTVTVLTSSLSWMGVIVWICVVDDPGSVFSYHQSENQRGMGVILEIYVADDPENDHANEAGNMGREVPDPRDCFSRHMSETNRRKLWRLNYQEAAIFLQEGSNNDKFKTHPRSHEALPAYEVCDVSEAVGDLSNLPW